MVHTYGPQTKHYKGAVLYKGMLYCRGEVKCEEKIGIFSQKLSVYKVDKEEGKEATTTFTKLSYNGKTSVVQCKYLTSPIPGRVVQSVLCLTAGPSRVRRFDLGPVPYFRGD